MAIYTKTGDKGTTSLATGERVTKTDARIEAYGTVDELNSFIGLLRAEQDDAQLTWIQHRLFNLGASLSDAPGTWITETDVRTLEQWIDALQERVPRQKAFVLPSGDRAACLCHVCRTVCRRAERRMLDAQAAETEMQFINRLSDYLFVAARYLAHLAEVGDMAWKKDFSVEKLTD